MTLKMYQFLCDGASHKKDVKSVDAIEYEGKFFVSTASRDCMVSFWLVEDDQLAFHSSHSFHNCFVNSVIIFRKNDRLFSASGGSDGRILIYDIFKAKIVAEIRAHDDNVCKISYSEDGSLFSCSWDGSVRVWNGTKQVSIFRSNEGPVWGAIRLDKSFIVANADGSLRFCSEENGDERTLRGHDGVARVLKKSVNQETFDFLSAGNDGYVPVILTWLSLGKLNCGTRMEHLSKLLTHIPLLFMTLK